MSNLYWFHSPQYTVQSYLVRANSLLHARKKLMSYFDEHEICYNTFTTYIEEEISETDDVVLLMRHHINTIQKSETNESKAN